MIAVEEVRATLPDAARDIRLNLQSVLESGALNDAQKWGVALACAIASRNPRLRDAVLQDALAKAGDAVVEDAKAAAVLMAMNNVYYRFRHMIGKPAYSQKRSRSRARSTSSYSASRCPRSTAARPVSEPTSRSWSKAA